jgi:transposase
MVKTARRKDFTVAKAQKHYKMSEATWCRYVNRYRQETGDDDFGRFKSAKKQLSSVVGTMLLQDDAVSSLAEPSRQSLLARLEQCERELKEIRGIVGC